jgi:hypothetical protein
MKKKGISVLNYFKLIKKELPISEKYNAPRARSTALSLVFAALPERGLMGTLEKTGGAEILSGNVENVSADW